MHLKKDSFMLMILNFKNYLEEQIYYLLLCYYIIKQVYCILINIVPEH